MDGDIRQVLDTKGPLRCVRFASGNVGVVDTQDRPVLVLGPYQGLRFAKHGFLKVSNGREFFVDMKNGKVYAQMPEILRFGDFELASIGNFLCTRTKRLYEVNAIPAEAELRKQGLYLRLPYEGNPQEGIVHRLLEKRKRYEVCLLDGDERGVYWLVGVFGDGTPLVMDDGGNYFRVRMGAGTGKAVKVRLGKVENEADKAMMVHKVREIEEQVADRLRREAMKAKRRAEKEREVQMAALASAEPFNIGNKWGLRKEGRMVVPPIYREVRKPVGRYCAFEKNIGQWGVMAVDGKIEVEPRFEEVVIHSSGMVDLTVRPGKVVTRKLP